MAVKKKSNMVGGEMQGNLPHLNLVVHPDHHSYTIALLWILSPIYWGTQVNFWEESLPGHFHERARALLVPHLNPPIPGVPIYVIISIKNDVNINLHQLHCPNQSWNKEGHEFAQIWLYEA